MRCRISVAAGVGILAVALAASCGGDDPVDPMSATLDGGPDGSAGDGGADGPVGPRPPNATCKAPPRPPIAASGGVTFEKAFPNLQVELLGEGMAIQLRRARFGANGPMRWFMVQRDGRVWTFVDSKASKTGLAADGVTPVEKAELFFEAHESISFSVESGLLSVALDPDFGLRDDSTYAYLHFTHNNNNQVWRYHIKRVGAAWVVDEMTNIMQVRSGGTNHWGGEMMFGPDGYLYLALGDGGFGFDAVYAQSTNRLRGKILRIDPRGKTTYAIPADNPYRLGSGGAPNPSCNDQSLDARVDPCPEVYAKGLRNPYRGSFDRDTGKLWFGDVGAYDKEEVNLVEKGHDYGWVQCEGDIPTNFCPPVTKGNGVVAPVAMFRTTTESTAVIGGVVYRGIVLPQSFRGAYLFAEIYNGEVLVIDDPYKNVVAAPFDVTSIYEHPTSTSAYPKFRKLAFTLPGLSSFFEDEAGEIYVTMFDPTVGGAVLKMVPATAAPPDTIPTKLSATGCVDVAAPDKPAKGVIPYRINAPFWSDGADKERFFAIPDDAKLTVAANGRVELPKNGVAMKHFRVGGKLVETRLFVRHDDGGYAGYTYVWQDDGKDAVLASSQGESKLIGSQVWSYPSRAGCLTCHNAPAGSTLGLELAQLHNGSQLAELAKMEVFDKPIDVGPIKPLDDPFGAADIDRRARVYLDVNCSMCHRAGARPDLELGAPSTKLCDAPALAVPGQPNDSPLIARLTDPNRQLRMPRGGGNVIDQKGVTLLRDWLTSRTTCP